MKLSLPFLKYFRVLQRLPCYTPLQLRGQLFELSVSVVMSFINLSETQ